MTYSDIDTIGLLYEAANRADLWPEVLHRLAVSVGGGAAVIALVDNGYGEANFAHYSSEISPENIEDYMQTYLAHDRPETILDAPAGKIITDEDAWPNRDEFYSNPFIQWRQARLGLLHSWGTNLNNGEGWKDGLMIQCTEHPWPPSATSRKKLKLLFPHVARSLRFSRLRAIAEAKYRQFIAVLDRLEVGIVLLQHTREVGFVNEEAKRVMAERGGLKVHHAQLRALDAAEDVLLQQLISEAIVAMRKSGPSSGGGQCVVLCADLGEPCSVEVNSLRDPEFGGGAFVIIIDPEHSSTFRLEGLRQLYKLTHAEIGICELLATGMATSNIADARNTTPATVKTQLANVFAKTGRNSQLDLLRLIVKINPPFKG